MKSTKPINIKSYLIEQLTKHLSDANAPLQAFCHRVKIILILEIQAIKAMKEENIYTILNNPNFDIARTSKGLSDTFYSLSITPTDIEQVIQITGPEVILLNFGEQTALNCGIQLHELGILQKYSSVLFSATFPETDRISGFVEDREELISLVTSLLTNSSQLLIDKSLKD
ncbi:unnamed protein product [Rotaria sp. Silwood2]|nr:unnamed protein product [Rotaria sp. Silwood2]